MGWHAGNSLSQTVFTLLYAHEVTHMRTDWFYRLTSTGSGAHERPIQLVTEVLRSSVYALLKSCDLVWAELMRGSVHEVRLACASHFQYHLSDVRWRISTARNRKYPYARELR